MSRPATSLPTSFFEEFYGRDPEGDPWKFATSDYERDKYAASLGALPRARYEAAFEVGCSIGVLTHQLAPRCGRLLAVDAAEAPLTQARARCARMPQVEIRRARMPEEWPAGERFDLVLLSEVLYFFDAADLARMAERTLEALRPGGDAVLVHWLPEADPPFPQTGEAAVNGFLAETGDGLRLLATRREPLYRLDVLRRT